MLLDSLKPSAMSPALSVAMRDLDVVAEVP